MNGKAGLAIIVLFAGALASAQSLAQTMYRCGKTYQDRPCDGGQKGKVIGSTTSSPEQAAPGADRARSDTGCTQLGVDAQKIVWAREGGRTQEQQIAEAGRGARERRLVMEVYARRGSSVEIRNAIEAECLAEREREAQAAALVRALGMQPGAAPAATGSGAEAGATQPTPEQLRAAEAKRQQEASARAADLKKQRCLELDRQMEGLRARERTGGNTATMDALATQRRQINARQSQEGC